MQKTALITGASQRIGKQIAQTLHATYNIIIHYNHSQIAAQNLAFKLNKIRLNSAQIMQGNLAKEEDINKIINKINKIDLLVNNASVFYPTPIEKTNRNDFYDMMNINILAPLLLVTKLTKKLAKNKGNIINIVDIHAIRPLKNYSIYNISKAGIKMLTQTLAQELAPNIRVNGIAPGSILWPEKKSELTLTNKDKILKKIPLAKQGTPLDIARAALFLATNNYITGQIINIDGGRTLNQ